MKAITGDVAGILAFRGVLPWLDVRSWLSLPLVALLALSLLPWTRRVMGFTERLFLADVNAWLLIASLALAAHGGSM